MLCIAQEISRLWTRDLFELKCRVADAEMRLQFGVDLFKDPIGG